MPKHLRDIIHFGESQIPLKIYYEWRDNVRVAFGKNAVYLRIPRFLPKFQKTREVEKAKVWAHRMLERREDLRSRFAPSSYADGDVLEMRGEEFPLVIREANRKSSKGEIAQDGHIHLSLVPGLPQAERLKTIRHLLSRLMAQHFRPMLEARVHALNTQHFQEKINKIALKYNSSNWGSCSTNNIINLSTRLLFTPDPVLDYVIIHELAHLKEMNHGPRFWAWVERADPDYKTKVKWLKEHGHKCDFR